MYTSPDEDRSDLYLAGAVYVFGPVVFQLLLEMVPPATLAPVIVPLSFVITLLTTIAVPIWLIRYRKQRLGDYGFDGSWPALGAGLLASLPVAAVYVIVGVVADGQVLNRIPVVATARFAPLLFAFHVLSVLCVVLLAIYMVVKARTAFRSDPRYLRATALELGRYLAIAAAVATLLLVLTLVLQGDALQLLVEFILAPFGVAGVVWLVLRSLRGTQLTSRPVLLTGIVVLAIRSVTIFDDAFNIVFGIWHGALLAGLGLVIGLLMESRRSAFGPLGLGIGLALLSSLMR